MNSAPMVSTYSMWSLFRNCRKAVEWRYLEQLVPIQRDRNLHFGSLIHECLQTWHQRRDLPEVQALIDRLCPNRRQDENQRRDWHLATAMMRAYAARYATEEFEAIALEKNFEGPIVNPGTGAPSRSFVLAGKYLKTDLHTCGLDLDKISDLPKHLKKLLDVKLEVTKKTKGDNENIFFNRRIENDRAPEKFRQEAGDALKPF